MPLTRSVRKQENSLVVGIPSQLAILAGLEAGDIVEWEYLGKDSLRILKSRPKTGA